MKSKEAPIDSKVYHSRGKWDSLKETEKTSTSGRSLFKRIRRN